MLLTIWRHGQAAAGDNDRLRELTDVGRDDVGFGSQRLHVACGTNGIKHPDHILYSPLVRTTQTARIIAAAFTHAPQAIENALQPGGDVGAVASAVQCLRDASVGESHVLMVSHQPLISALVDYYLGAGNSVPFLTPGAWVTMSFASPESSGGRLLFWALPPEFEVHA